MRRTLIAFAFLIATLPAAQATGRYTCEPVAADQWLTERQLTAKLAADGWKVKRMKKDGGCWEVYGNMPDGTFVEGYFHPASGEKLFVSQRGKVLFKKQ